MRSYGDELIEQGVKKGVTQARAEYVLRALTARGVAVDEVTRQRILSCTDLATLDVWFDRALNASRLSDVLGDSAH